MKQENKKNILGNFKKTMVIIVVILLIIATGVLGNFFTSKSFDEKNINITNILQKEIEILEKTQEASGEGFFKISGIQEDGSKINFKTDLTYLAFISLLDKKLSVNLTTRNNFNIPILNLNAKNLDLGLNLKFITDKVYLKIETDLDQIANLTTNEQLKSMILLGGNTIINKDLVLNSASLPAELAADLNFSNIFNSNSTMEMINLVEILIEKHQPFQLEYTGKTKRINGERAGKFKIVINIDNSIDFVLDFITSISAKNNMVENYPIEIEQIATFIKMNQDILVKNISGNIFVWVTAENLLVKSDLVTKVNLNSLLNEFNKITGIPINLKLNSLNLEIELEERRKLLDEINIVAPTGAIDIMEILPPMLPPPVMTVEPLSLDLPADNLNLKEDTIHSLPTNQ